MVLLIVKLWIVEILLIELNGVLYILVGGVI